jgi:hypothetical protein
MRYRILKGAEIAPFFIAAEFLADFVSVACPRVEHAFRRACAVEN